MERWNASAFADWLDTTPASYACGIISKWLPSGSDR